jgi:uncharacterized protein YggE
MKSFRLPVFGCCAWLWWLSGALLAAQETLPNSISVRATGTVMTKPDAVFITVYVVAEAATIEKALQQTSRKADEIKSALAQGFPEIKELRVAEVKIGEKSGRIVRYDDAERPPRPEAAKSVLIVVEAASTNLHKIVDTALELGARLQCGIAAQLGDPGSVVQYGLMDPGKAEAEAMQQALAEAHERASRLAAAAGGRLGEIIAIADEGPPWPARAVYWRSGQPQLPARYVSTSSEGVEVSRAIRVTYELKK